MTNPPAMHPYEDFRSGLSAENVAVLKDHAARILRAPNLLGDQKKDALSDAAYKTQPYPGVSPAAEQAVMDGRICLLSEGPAPYHPRYVAPDYQQLLKHGSDFMGLQPAQDLYEATANLLAAYKYLPDGGHPVFIGRLDELLEPFLGSVSDKEARHILRSFWLLVDRLYPTAFVHANLGPGYTRVGELLFEIDREIKTITNLTFRYDPEITEKGYALDAVRTALALGKPYFLNHPMMEEDWGPDYVVASCYNVMRPAGGIFTLVRLNLKEVVQQAKCSLDDILNKVIPENAQLQLEIINSRSRFLVEEIGWFKHNAFVAEGLLAPDQFTAYAGVYGLAEAVDIIMTRQGRPDAHYGHDREANEVAHLLIKHMAESIQAIPAEYCTGSQNRAVFHAQVGISADKDVTPAARIPAGKEPDLYKHISSEAPVHKWITGGVSTILEFDQTASENPEAILDIIRGAFRTGARNLSIGSKTSEFIRVTGYLMRRSDIEAAKAEKALRYDSSLFGVEVFENRPLALQRRVREV